MIFDSCDQILDPMADLPFHYGIVLRAYPSSKQIKTIKENANTDRFLYNWQIANDRANFIFKLYRIHYKWEHDDEFTLILVPWLCRSVFQEIKFDPIRLDIAFFNKAMFDLGQASKVTDEEGKVKRVNKIKNIKKLYPWMNKLDLDSLMYEQSFRKHRFAWNQFHKVHQTGIPKYHSKRNYRLTYQTANVYRSNKKKHIQTPTTLFTGSCHFIDRNHLKVPKLGVMRISGSQQRLFDLSKKQAIRIGTITICIDSIGRTTISLQLGSNLPFVSQKSVRSHILNKFKILGIDLNTSNFAYLSQANNGKHVIANPRYYRNALKKLKKLAHSLSRKHNRAKREGRSLRQSKNYQKLRVHKARLEAHVKACRFNFINNQVHDLIENQDLIVIENLQSKNMLKNHALAQSISDVGWGQFATRLMQVGEMYGVTVIKVDPKYTTQICNDCGFRMGTKLHGIKQHKLTLSDREWICPCCGVHHIRDHNASLNIVDKGIAKFVSSNQLSKTQSNLLYELAH